MYMQNISVTAVIGMHEVRGVFIPECTSNGDFTYRQCFNSYCWCVDNEGKYNGGLTNTPQLLACDPNGKKQLIGVDCYLLH